MLIFYKESSLAFRVSSSLIKKYIDNKDSLMVLNSVILELKKIPKNV